MTVPRPNRSTRWCLAIGACVALVLSPSASTAQIQQSPADRDALLQRLRTTFPTMPERLVSNLADSGGRPEGGSPCELLAWFEAPEADIPAPNRERALAELTASCSLPVDDITPDLARERLGDSSFSAQLTDGVVTVVASSAEDQVRLCCSLQGNLQHLGNSHYWATRRRLPQAEHAMLTLSLISGSTFSQERTVIRGPLAPPAPPQAAWPLQGRIVVPELLSAALGETRKLQVYLPPGWSKEKRWPAVYLTDGAALGFAGVVEQMILDGEIPPLVMVSALPAPFGIVGEAPADQGDLRSAEYIHGRDRFDRHMEFFATELTRYAQTEFGVSPERQDVAVAGYSNGGVFALWAGLLHPEAFGDAIAMSPGIVQIADSDLTRTPRARFQLSGGAYEPGFKAGAQSAETSLKAAGFDVTSRYPVAGHAQDQWEFVFYQALKQLFSKELSGNANRLVVQGSPSDGADADAGGYRLASRVAAKGSRND